MASEDPFTTPDFRLLFESSPALYLVLDPDHTIIAVTDAYAQATMTRRDGILGRNLFEVFPDNPVDPHATGTRNLRESLDRAVTGRGSDTMAVQKYDIRKPEPEGGGFEERYWSPVNTAIFGKDGNLAFIIHRVEDVTEFVRIKRQGTEQGQILEELRARAGRMELEVFQRAQEIQEANRNLVAANADLARSQEAAEAATRKAESAAQEFEAFSYSVSHDLRAPLRTIDGFSMLLMEKFAPALEPAARDYLVKVRAGTGRMAALIDDLLELARVSHSPLALDSVDLSRMAGDISSRLGESHPERRAVFRIEPGVEAKGDPRFLRVLLENLLGNSFKFTSRKPEAIIEFGQVREERKPVYFVKDNGVGFDSRFVDKLFGTFQRLHTEAEFEGTGIGLATARRIVHRHGGCIRAESELGNGAVFRFTLENE
ncbi:MAG: ATP-binding protein [Fibrobacteria bacterium]